MRIRPYPAHRAPNMANQGTVSPLGTAPFPDAARERSENTDYAPINQAQLELASGLSQVMLVNDNFRTMRAHGLIHYFQQTYNEVGIATGTVASRISNTSS